MRRISSTNQPLSKKLNQSLLGIGIALHQKAGFN